MALIFALFNSNILAVLRFIVDLCEGKLGNTARVLQELVAERCGDQS